MKLSRRATAAALTLALGLGVWGTAVNYTPATLFVDGNTLTAAQLNAEFNAIQTAVASKLNLAGGSLTGRLDVVGTATNPGAQGDLSTVLNVRNLGSSGSAAVFRAQADATNNDPVVAIKGNGTGPALSVKNAASGPLMVASNATGARFVVESDGSIRVGALGSAGTSTPSLRINATNGTIANAVGSGLPLAYGTVTGAGGRNAETSTSNWTARRLAPGRYEIAIPNMPSIRNTTVVTPLADAARSATVLTRYEGGQILLDVRVFNAAGTLTDTPFAFITFKPGL